jgi:hypothetical protein
MWNPLVHVTIRLIAANLFAALVTTTPPDAVRAGQTPPNQLPRESRISVGNASLYARDVGRGESIIVLHGGPDFDHLYLLPDLDRFADTYRLVYYDQRGRGHRPPVFGPMRSRSSPTRVSRLILMNPAPASTNDVSILRTS